MEEEDAADAGTAPRPWVEIGREKLRDCKVFEVSRTMSRSPRTGEVHPFYRIDAVDWVNVVALTPADEIVMVRQYRHGAREITLEIPGGMVDVGESPAAAAARELLEETGFRGLEAEHLGTVNPNPAIFGNDCHTYLIRDAVRVAPIRNDGETEETTVELLPRADLNRRILEGDIPHALVMIGFYWLSLSGVGPGR